MNVPSADVIGKMIDGALQVAQSRSTRSTQSRVGASEVGWCRQQMALKIGEVPKSDSRKMWAAYIGTAIHDSVFADLRPIFPDWIIESEEVTATLPSGVEIVGHPDIIVPEWNMVIDLKTKDGLESVRRYGGNQSNRWQVWLYAKGAMQAGLLDPDKPVYCALAYLDRSGKSDEVYVTTEEFDPTLESEINEWLNDVIYAVQHREDAHRDIAAPVCERICEYFTVCRGSLPVGENEIIDSPEIRQAVEQFVTARDEEKTAKRLKDEARTVLTGLNGVAGGYQIRTTEIPESDVPGFTRAASTRLDVRKVRA